MNKILFALLIIMPLAMPAISEASRDSVIQYMRDGASLAFANELLKEAERPINYDAYLEFEQLRLNSGQERTKIKPFGQEFPFFGGALRATGDDAMTFYVDPVLDENAIKKASGFLYGWPVIPPGFIGGDSGISTATPGTLLWPVPGQKENQRFGCVPSDGYPYENIRNALCSGGEVFHNGIDINASFNEPVLSAAKGEVLASGYDSIYGKFVVIWHADLGISTIYCHLSSQNVGAGELVEQGVAIGGAGMTGSATTGVHLHFMVVPGETLGPSQSNANSKNPSPYF